MDYGRLGERQRRLTLPVLEILSSIMLLVAVVLIMLELVQYSKQKDALPTDLTIAGVAVGGLSESDAQARLESVYTNQVVQLVYDGNLILLRPSEVNFRLSSDLMLSEAITRSNQQKSFWGGFWNYLERRAVAAVSVPLDATIAEGDLRDYLENVAARYDTQSGQAGFDLATLTFNSGRAGRRLAIDQAIPLVEQALLDPEPDHRRVVLPLANIDATRENVDTLREAILALMQSRGFVYNGTDTVASVYIMNLATGEEVRILSDVAHSAVSTIKIPIMINLFRKELLVSQDEAYLLTESILCSNNASSNLLMQLAGNGDYAEAQLRDGLNQVSCTAQALGADHTYISAPLDVDDVAYQFEASVCRPQTPANTSYNTEPDPYSQTTAEDMGRLLTQIYDCANYGSGLMAIYPQDITQTECKQMIQLLSGNYIDRLIALGLPEGTQLAHKNGWGRVTSADAGIVFSPGGDYVLSMYTYERDTDNNRLPTLASWELIEEVSRLTWNYFNPDQPLLQPRQPLNPYGAVECISFNPQNPDVIDLNDINANRVDANGAPLPTGCYGGAAAYYSLGTGQCLPWDNYGRGN
jgi:beta-lactamase class A